MKIDLCGKTALVTASTGGIGNAIADGLLGAGANVWINGRGQERVDKVVAQFRTKYSGVSVQGIAADMGSEEQITRLLDVVGEVDILVNNAGTFSAVPFFEITDADWKCFFEINVLAGIRLARYFAPKMVAKGWGRVLWISSESGVQIPVEMVHYGMTKTAQLAVSRGLAKTLANTGVTSNAVLPGPTWSEGVEGFLKQMTGEENPDREKFGREFIEVNRPTSLIKRFASSEEVANLVVYLASELSSATTGAGLRVDGGVVDGLL